MAPLLMNNKCFGLSSPSQFTCCDSFVDWRTITTAFSMFVRFLQAESEMGNQAESDPCRLHVKLLQAQNDTRTRLLGDSRLKVRFAVILSRPLRVVCFDWSAMSHNRPVRAGAKKSAPVSALRVRLTCCLLVHACESTAHEVVWLCETIHPVLRLLDLVGVDPWLFSRRPQFQRSSWKVELWSHGIISTRGFRGANGHSEYLGCHCSLSFQVGSCKRRFQPPRAGQRPDKSGHSHISAQHLLAPQPSFYGDFPH